MTLRLFRHGPTGRWLPIVQDAKELTPGEAYVPDLAREYGLAATDIVVVRQDRLPVDFESHSVPVPARPRTLPIEQDPVFRATVATLIDLVNVERQAGGRQPVTLPQFVAAVKAKL